MAAQSPPTLYDRLGGIYSIATFVDDFIDRIMTDPRLNANPLVDEAHHRVPPAGFKYLVTEMVCWAAGGPQKYTGRSMRDSHQKLKIALASAASSSSAVAPSTGRRSGAASGSGGGPHPGIVFGEAAIVS